MNSSLDDQNCILLRENNKLKEQIEIKNRELDKLEHVLLANLAHKEQEIADLSAQIEDMKASSNPCNQQLRCMGLDPAVNAVFLRIKKDMKAANEKLEQTQNDLQAWKFTPDSQTGKRMMTRMRVLLQENEELGKMNQSGRTAKLESEIAMRRTLIEELKQTNSEYENVIDEMDTETDCFQTSIFMLQQQLASARKTISTLCCELDVLSPGKSETILSECHWIDTPIAVGCKDEPMETEQEVNGGTGRTSVNHVTDRQLSISSDCTDSLVTSKRVKLDHNCINSGPVTSNDLNKSSLAQKCHSSSPHPHTPSTDHKRATGDIVELKLEPVAGASASRKLVSKKHSSKSNSAFNTKKLTSL